MISSHFIAKAAVISIPLIFAFISVHAEPGFDPAKVKIYRPKPISKIIINDSLRSCSYLTEILAEPKCLKFDQKLARNFLTKSKSLSKYQFDHEAYHVGCEGPSGSVIFNDKSHGHWTMNLDNTGTLEIGANKYLLYCETCKVKEVPCPSSEN